MVVYDVSWFHKSALAKGKGRVKSSEMLFGFTVLCRSAHDALSCVPYHFYNKFKHRDHVCLDDGEIILKRSIVDSRNFTINYLMMDNIREPIELSNLKDNCLRVHQIFGI